MDLAMMLSGDKRDDPPLPPADLLRQPADLHLQPDHTAKPADSLETPPKRARIDSHPHTTPSPSHPAPSAAANPSTPTAPPPTPASSRPTPVGLSPAGARPPPPQPPAQPDSVIAAASSAARRDMQAPATPYADLQRAVHNALENKTAALTTSDKVALALEVLRARQLELDLAQARNNIEALVTKTGSAPRTLRAVIPASSVKGLPVGTPVEIGKGKLLLSPTANDPQALFLTLELQSFGEQGEGSAEKDDKEDPNAS